MASAVLQFVMAITRCGLRPRDAGIRVAVKDAK